MDEDVVQLVICLPELAETVTKNPLIRHVTCESHRPFDQRAMSQPHG